MQNLKVRKFGVLLSLMAVFVSSCGLTLDDAENDASKEDRAKTHLDKFEFTEAIALYEELIAEQPTEYRFYALIATCHAGRGGIDILNIASQKINKDTPVLEQIQAFIPGNPTDDQLNDVQTATDYLTSIPDDADLGDSLPEALTNLRSVYYTAQSAMVINKFSEITPTGQLDPEKLEEMTADDAEQILESLQSAAEAGGNEKLNEKLNETLDEINSSEGGDALEQLKNYLQNA